MRVLATTFLAALLLSGCATQIMSEEECFIGDWYGAGLEDGAQGLTEAALGARADQCAGFGAPPPDGAAYQEGRNAALSRLCTYTGGYDYGRSGNDYRGVCRPDREAEFLGGYLEGRRLFVLASEIEAAEDSYKIAIDTLDFRRRKIRDARKVIDDPEATAEEVEKAREEIKDDRDILPFLRSQVDERLYDLWRAEEAYDQALSGVGGLSSAALARAVETLVETHSFAREEDAIDFCTDDIETYAPSCAVRPGAAITDTATGAVCAMGPGEATLEGRRPSYVRGFVSGQVLTFEYFPEGSAGLFRRRASGGFDVVQNEDGDTVRIACLAGL